MNVRLMIGAVVLVGLGVVATLVRAEPAATAQPVSIVDFTFEPANLNISIGDSVTWTNNGTTAHTTSSDTSSLVRWDSGTLNTGEQFTVVFTATGSFSYRCTIHPAMTGTIQVDAGPAPAAYLPLVLVAQASAQPPTASPAITPLPTLTAPATTATITATIEPPSATPISSATPTATPGTTATPPISGTIKIITIDYNPSSDPLAERVEIRNASDQPVDMTGWTLRDLANNVYTFPTFTLAAGATVNVWTMAGTNDASNLYWGRGVAVWNNNGDTAILQNAAGVEIDRYSY